MDRISNNNLVDMLQLQNVEDAKRKLHRYDPVTFNNAENSFVHFLLNIEIADFRHIKELSMGFEHPVTVVSGNNKIGKTSLLLLIACSHINFKRIDSTKPDTVLRNHEWRDVISFTSYEAASNNYSYKLSWRVGNTNNQGEGKRLASSKAWTGLAKFSSDPHRINAKIRGKEVRLIDLERVTPARNVSNSLLRKITSSTRTRLSVEIEQSFQYILELPSTVEIYRIGSHVNKVAFLIAHDQGGHYSSYNAASGEESLLNILLEIVESPIQSLILIDEIEAGFHPTTQRRLADVIQYYSWTQKKQFIITTHSPTLLAEALHNLGTIIHNKLCKTF